MTFRKIPRRARRMRARQGDNDVFRSKRDRVKKRDALARAERFDARIERYDNAHRPR